uniref:Biotin-(Acetyl-CoA carboxylase) ligase n=1 Tax=Eubacterium cellulosolvens (strain ATCC 43171 / JCM 9499 / 6) TaxID=633697 RepID=I5ARA0_EUBC6
MLKEQIIHDLTLLGGQPVSGQELADRYHVSRNAIWKAIQSLKENNIPIITVGRKGYALPPDLDLLTEAGIRQNLIPEFQDLPILIYDEIDSTNTEARRRIARGNTAPALLVTGRQTKGRGHKGSSFESPDKGLYMTLIFRTELPPDKLILISKAAAAAVCTSHCQNDTAPLSIREVSDLWQDGKKAGGILTEAIAEDVETGTYNLCFTGIGLRLAHPAMQKISRARLAAEIAVYLLTADYRHPEAIERHYKRFHI